MYLFALILSLICWVGVGFVFVRGPAFSVFHPLLYYIAFHGLVFVIRPICGYFLHYDIIYQLYDFTPSMSDRLTVLFASNLGLLCFAGACLWKGNVPMRFAQDQFDAEERRRLVGIFACVAAICGPLAVYSLMHARAAGASMVLDAGTGIAVNTEANGYLTDAPLMLASITGIVLWLGRFRLPSWLPLVAYVVVRATLGRRGPFVSALVIAALLYFYENRRKLPGAQFLIACVLIGGLFNFVGKDRGAAVRQALGMERAQTSISDVVDDNSKFLENMDYANLEFFEYIVYVVPQRAKTYDYFLSNLALLTDPIPRVWWKGKPIGAPFQPVKLWNYGYPIGMTFSLPGIGWYEFGWFGVVIWCSLWGWALGLMYRKFVQGTQSTIEVATYVAFLSTLVVGYRDGDVESLVKQAAMFLAPVLIWYALSRLMGIPRAAVMRRRAWLLARRPQDGADPAEARDEPALESAASGYLPPAARRRRLALQAMRENQV